MLSSYYTEYVTGLAGMTLNEERATIEATRQIKLICWKFTLGNNINNNDQKFISRELAFKKLDKDGS